MKTLFNPTENTIEVQIFGVKYVLDSKSTVTVSDEVAKYWINLHAFLEEVQPKVEKEIKEEVSVVETKAVKKTTKK